ncbi:MAG: peptidase A26 [Thermoplasmata archaeon]|nr:MAG: peptidase A26 [Thermoplasmata archaeon]
MRRRISILFVCLMMVATVFAVAVPTNVSAVGEYSEYFAGGSGTPEDPYQISNVDELQNMHYDLTAHYILVNDIDASATSGWNSGAGFEPIGTFTGTFDGKGYKITNLYINRPSTNYIGLFGITRSCIISGVGLEDLEGSGNNYVGGLVGANWDGTLENCYATGSVSGISCIVGGLVGVNSGSVENCYATDSVSGSCAVGGLVGEIAGNGALNNCYATGDVSGTGAVGGLAGTHMWGSVENCYATGSVSGNNDDVGGLIGYNFEGSVKNCYATGSISGNNNVGGLVGDLRSDTWFIVWNCYATGSVSGNNNVGGLVGINYDGWVENCYASGSVSGNYDVGGLVGWNGPGEWVYWGTVKNCYATGSISGNVRVGGLVGRNSYGTLENCYATGSVSGSSAVGGFIGNNSGLILSSYWDTETSGQSSSDGGIGKTTAEMKQQATFVDWDFENIWRIIEDVTYPYLWWEIILPVDLIEEVEVMDLPVGIENSMVSILEAAINSLENGNDNVAVNQLEALIFLIEAIRGKKLTDEEADGLIAMAQWIIDNLS